MTVRRIPILGISTVPGTSGDVYPLGYDYWASNDVWDRMVMAFYGSGAKVGLTGGFTVPEDYRSDPSIKIEWTAAVTTGTVVWDFEYRAVGGDNLESFDQMGTQEAVTVTDTAPTAIHRKITSTLLMTEANFVANDEVVFNLYRNGASESTAFMNSPALVKRVDFQYDTGIGTIADPSPIPAPPPSASTFVVGIAANQFISGSFDSAGQAFTVELGAHSIRVAFNHGSNDGGPDFAVNWAADRGIGVCYMLGYGVGCNVLTAEGRQCYADRSAGLVALYGNKVQYWEVWNEWNGGLGLDCIWNQSPCNDGGGIYTDLLRRTYLAIKNVDPNAKVAAGVTSGVHLAWTAKMYDAGGGNYLDVVSVHPYAYLGNRDFAVSYTATPTVGVDKFVEALTAQHNQGLQKTGRSIPIIVTEEGRPDDGSTAGLNLTAAYLSELYNRVPTELPFLEGIWWYDLEDFGSDGYGLLRNNNTKKPAFFAFQGAAAALA